jgi:hypothetical protein
LGVHVTALIGVTCQFALSRRINVRKQGEEIGILRNRAKIQFGDFGDVAESHDEFFKVVKMLVYRTAFFTSTCIVWVLSNRIPRRCCRPSQSISIR